MKAILQDLAAVLAGLTIAVIALSLCFEFGYFMQVGIKYLGLLTTADLLANGTLWVALVTCLMAINWRKLTASPPTEKTNWKEWRNWIWPILFVASFAYMVGTTRWPPPSIFMVYLFSCAFFFWQKIWRDFAGMFNFLGEEYTVPVRSVVAFGPPMMAGMVVYGYFWASMSLTTKAEMYTFRLKDGRHVERSFMRSFDRGVLVRNDTLRQVEFHKWDEIIGITAPIVEQRRSLCEVVGLCAIERRPYEFPKSVDE